MKQSNLNKLNQIKGFINNFLFKSIPVLLILFLATTVIAQPGKGRQSWLSNYEIAQQLLKKSSYYNATIYLEKALDLKGNNDVDLLYLLADTYEKARNYKSAALNYEFVLRNDSDNKYINARWHYANMLKQSGEYEKAIKEFNIVSSVMNDDIQKVLIQNAIEGCEMGMSGKEANIISLEILDIINTNYSEFAPMPLEGGEIIYSTLKSNELILPEEEMIYSKIFKTTVEKNGDLLEEGTPMTDIINKKGIHNGHGTYTDNGKKFYFTRCPSQENNLADCKIFVTTLRNEEWTEPRRLGVNINPDESSNSTPFFIDGKLFFSSNRKGGMGGMDIWVSYLQSDGSFARASNLGRYINSPGDEITPFYNSKDRLLYFSSNGHSGYGGFDIFKAAGTIGNWMVPENLFQPINTPADDMYFSLDETMEKGYFSSNRVGIEAIDNETCCDDIFTVQLNPSAQMIELEGIVYDSKDPLKIPMDDARVELFEINEKGDLDLISSVVTFNQQGYKFRLNNKKKYVIRGSKENHTVKEETILPSGRNNIRKDLGIHKNCIEISGLVFGNDSKSKQILEGATVAINEINDKGELVEITKITTTKEGYKLCAPINKNIRIIASKDGYLTDSYDINTNGDYDKIRYDLELKKEELNLTYQIDNILYDFNSSILRSASKDELNNILRLLQLNPNIILEIGSHTDSKGSVEYNVSLSERRAQSVVEYLIGSGIPSHRLQAKGYGESKPIARNKNKDGTDNPEGRQLNRRTEFKIVGKVSNVN